jgi:hypothetical protein
VQLLSARAVLAAGLSSAAAPSSCIIPGIPACIILLW